MAQRMDFTDNSSQPSSVYSDAKGETANKPTCIVCLGMAGSGKTTFMQVSILATPFNCGSMLFLLSENQCSPLF